MKKKTIFDKYSQSLIGTNLSMFWPSSNHIFYNLYTNISFIFNKTTIYNIDTMYYFRL